MTHSVQREQINVIILDDDPFFCRLVSSFVSNNADFTVHEASTGDQLTDLLDEGNTDCIILDYNLGFESGFAVQERLRQRFGTLPPVIMLTGDERQSTVIKAFHLGVRDFMPKRGLKCEALLSSIRGAIGRDRADRQVQADIHRLSGASFRDPKTGLATRAALDARFAELASSNGRGSETPGLIAIEIRELPFISCTFGLDISAQVIRAFATKLRSALRISDLCGQYINGVFLIIGDLQDDSAAIDKLCARLSETLSFRLDLDAIGIDISARIRCIESVEAIGTEELSDGWDRIACKNNISFAPQGPGETSSPFESSRSVNRRREPRQRVFKRGQIILSGLTATIDCTVRNISSHGAGLRLDAPVAAPAEFELDIAGADTRRRARVRWQAGRDLGVEYLI